MSGETEEGGGRLRWMLGLLAALAVPVALIWWPGCRQYPPVTSKEALSAMKLLYSACNTKDPVRLAEAERRVADLAAGGRMAPAEKAAFDRIITQARAGDWAAAEAAAFKFAQDQVGRGHPDPDQKPGDTK